MPKRKGVPPDKKSFLKMPIVNGSYVAESLPDSRQAQQQVFGSYSKRDMNDYSAAAYNYLMKQQEQAYNLELWHLMNEYNSPSAQMQRYQDAGLNPNLIYGQQNTASAPASASSASFRTGNVQSRQQQNALNMIGQFRNIVQSAWETYKYFTPYERNMRSFDQMLGGLNLRRSQADVDYLEYLTYGINARDPVHGPEYVPGSPRAQMYNLDANTKQAQYDRLVALANMIPDQIARTQALEELDRKRLSILQGQNDAVLNIHTGNSTVDSWLKALMYFAMSKL